MVSETLPNDQYMNLNVHSTEIIIWNRTRECTDNATANVKNSYLSWMRCKFSDLQDLSRGSLHIALNLTTH